MREINLFTPITFGNQPRTINEKRIEFYDSYFNVTGWSARIISKNELEKSYDADWHYEAPNYLISALKVLSYAIVIIPLIVLVIKQNLREGFVFKFKEIDSKPKSPEFNLDGENQEFKVRSAVDFLLKQGKIDSANKLLEGRAGPYIEELKARISLEESKRAIARAIKAGESDKAREILSRYSTSEKDELIEAWVLESEDVPFEITHEISNEYNKLSIQKKILEAMIKKAIPFESHLAKMQTSDEKDSVIKLAVQTLTNGLPNYETAVRILDENAFKRGKTAVLVLEEVSEKILGTFYAKGFLEILKKPLANKDDLLLKAMDVLLKAQNVELSKELMQIKCQSIYTKAALYQKYCSALVEELEAELAVEVMKSISKELYAKDAVKGLIKLLVEKDLYDKAAELISKDELYGSEFAEAFCDAAKPDRKKTNFDDPFYEVAQSLKTKGFNDLAARFFQG